MEWISVKDRLPKENCIVVFSHSIRGYFAGVFRHGKFTETLDDCEFFDEITHWMPLPKPPKE